MTNRVDGVSGAVDQGGCTVAGFVGVDRPGNTLANGQRDNGPCKTAHSRCAGESPLENLYEHSGNIGDVHQKNYHCCQQVCTAHDRDQLFRNSANGVFTPDQQIYNKQYIDDHHGHQVQSERGI